MLKVEEVKVGIIGLGYVGLPLAVEFGKLMPTVGFDINTNRIAELKSGKDNTLELNTTELSESLHLSYSDQLDALKTCNVYIVTVPTPIDRYKRPDLTPLESASRMLGEVI
ncbi:MAG: Vi polysaccharide biosynthesis UDP-N-acetylglucosamine C-6 dehydrogenase TviB, partial [Gammaproteobacteria bacterium]|nr:Vi polysaccharide biosynthesis UDP-N-acetylglucosamine C-6 dehydrogenase TviB [Gammaproteobacteria bacterium]